MRYSNYKERRRVVDGSPALTNTHQALSAISSSQANVIAYFLSSYGVIKGQFYRTKINMCTNEKMKTASTIIVAPTPPEQGSKLKTSFAFSFIFTFNVKYVSLSSAFDAIRP